MQFILILAALFGCLFYAFEQWEFIQFKKNTNPGMYNQSHLLIVHNETKQKWLYCAIGVCIVTFALGLAGRILFLTLFILPLWLVYCWHGLRLTYYLMREKKTIVSFTRKRRDIILK